jgi:hypothetical protein
MMHQWLLEPRKSARPTRALAWVVGLADWGVSLADLWQMAEVVGLADWGVSLADLEQTGVGLVDSEKPCSPPLLLVGA